MKLQNILQILNNNDVPFVIVGGVALNIHGSDRVTFDSDIAVKTIDADKVSGILIECGLEMVIGVDDDHYPQLTGDSRTARNFIEKSDWGFLKFISDNLEIDVLYETSVPFFSLYRESIPVHMGDFDVRIASLEHLKIMKEKAAGNRDDAKKNMDILDIAFIEKKIKERDGDAT